jgi:hypothetical protein
MRLPRSASFVVLPSILLCLSPAGLLAADPAAYHVPAARERWCDSPHHSKVISYHGGVSAATDTRRAAAARRADRKGGIREVVPDKYRSRYLEWKKEFLSTETGQRQWALFEKSEQLALTIMVSRDNPKGAGTGQYKWDDEGKLVEATIVLGSSLHEGYPNPIYYPVMNSLMEQEPTYAGSGHTLAAAKIAHEFGHLTRTVEMDHALYELQNRLMPVYNKILLSNGRNTSDPQLVGLAQQMGGTPVEIWEDREYWGEANAMLFLRDRFAEEDLGCSLFGRIKQSVNLYAKNYTERFLKVAQSSPSLNRCGWR